MNDVVCIVGGLGRVGLPLGLCLARAGKRVVLYDINLKAVETVQAGKMPFIEEGAEEILAQVLGKNLFISSDKKSISDAYFLIMVIGTPVDEHLNPKFTIFKSFFSGIMEYIRDTQHIILRSTVFPGTTEKVAGFLRANGKKTKVSFCPERIAEGKAIKELTSLPQIVASMDEESAQEAAGLFRTLTEDIVLLAPKEAEVAKLFTNVWRYIQFAISNQFYQITVGSGLDYHKIYDTIKFKYPRADGLPGAGFTAGPCLFKDTMQLAAYSNNNFFLGHAAMLVNEGLPNFIIQMLKERHSLGEKVVGILGMAFKADSDDSRESLSYKLRKMLEIEAREVLCTDPYVKDASLVDAEELMRRADIVIVGAPHSVYRQMELDFSRKVLVDVWNFFGKGDRY